MILLPETRQPLKCATRDTKLLKYEKKSKFFACWVTASLRPYLSSNSSKQPLRFSHRGSVTVKKASPRFGYPHSQNPRDMIFQWEWGCRPKRGDAHFTVTAGAKREWTARRLGTRQSRPSLDSRSQEEFARRFFALEWFYLTHEIDTRLAP